MKRKLKKHISMILGFLTAILILFPFPAGNVLAGQAATEIGIPSSEAPTTRAATSIKLSADQTGVDGASPVHITATWRDTGSLPLRAYIKVTNNAKILADGPDDIIFKADQIQAAVTEFSLSDEDVRDQMSFVTGKNSTMKNSSIEFQVAAPLQSGKDFEVEVFLSSATSMSSQNSSNTGTVRLNVLSGLSVETKDQNGQSINLVDDAHPFYIEGSALYQGEAAPADSYVLVVIQNRDTEEVVAEYELIAEIENDRYQFLTDDSKPLRILIPSSYDEGTYTITAYLIGEDILGSASKEFTFRKAGDDSIETAPAGELANWDYTLSSAGPDNSGPAIYLKNYKSTSEHVTIYGKYNVDGVLYSTILNREPSGYDIINPFTNASQRIKSIVIKEGTVSTDTRSLFWGLIYLESLDLRGLDTSKASDMSGMFHGCRNLTSLDLSGLDTSNVSAMANMFVACENLTSLDLSNWDTSNVIDMVGLFFSCYGLTSLNLSNWDTSKVTYTAGMFYKCQNLTTLDLTSFDTSNVSIMTQMFYRCYNLTQINVSATKWNTSMATTYEMFLDCGTSSVTLK